MLATGVAESDDQPVGRRPTAEGAQELLLGGGAALVCGRLARAGVADELGLRFDLALLTQERFSASRRLLAPGGALERVQDVFF